MDSPSQKLMISLVFCLAVFFSASSASAESVLVRELCRATKVNPECVAALNPDPRAAKATSHLSLGEIALQIAAENTTKRQELLDQMLVDPNTTSSWKPVLKTCKAHFETAARQFSTASRELGLDAMSANYDVWMASDEIVACLAFMRSSKQDIPPLVTSCNYVKTLVSIGDAITNRW
ncbi:hypothetical protein ACJRO7_007669 [Eucalyptus globulus]|uniref:Pectinesterase inhibitor domain-containing protein n=1 Tax=Eucalyptus globulus TaxID=34317 RepID=A0ABD3IMK3_EUCGL